MLKTSLELHDNFSATIHNIIESVNLSVHTMEELHQSVNTPLDSTALEGVRKSINRVAADVTKLDEAFKSVTTQYIEAPTFNGDWGVPNEAPKPTFNWVSPNFEVFTNSGIDRFKQELASANNLMGRLNESQLKLSNTASKIDILPDAMVSDLNLTQSRIQAIKDKIQELERTPLHLVDDSTNSKIEALRKMLSQAVDEQEALNIAVENMDFENANKTCLRLANRLDDVEVHIRDNINGQNNFNKKLQEGQNQASKLTSMIKGAIGTYLTINGVNLTLGISDALTSTTARLELMNDGLQSTEDLQNMIYLSAERSRGAYQTTAEAVSQLGLMAGEAFSSSAEIIAFTEQINKHFAIAGTEAAGISAAMLQLTQAMGSGVLRGEEYNSILEQAPNIIATIGEYLDVPKGKLREMAAEGQITAEVIKNAMFDMAGETNDKFNDMPKTFAQIGASIKNTALMAFQPVLQNLSKIANSNAFNILIDSVIGGLSTLANIALGVFNTLSAAGKFIADNWYILAPIFYGVATALGLYTAALVINNTVQGISAVIGGIIAFKNGILAASAMMAAGATFAQTAAQHGLNAALLASPITWIVLGIIAIITVVFLAANAIAKLTGVASNGFSLICGAINVAIQFFYNLLLVAANVGIGIGNVVGALAHNMVIAFSNSIINIQSWFFNLLSTALNVVAGICAALNKLPFISFDYSGVTDKASEYANKAASVKENKGEYKSIVGAFNEGFNTFDAFSDGWVSNAFNNGIAFGDSIGDKFSGFLDGFKGDSNIPNPNDYTDLSKYGELLEGNNTSLMDYADLGNYGGTEVGDKLSGIESGLGDIGSGVKDTAGNTKAIKDSVQISEEDLRYMRDMAERDVVNRFTTAQISLNMGGITNNVSSDMDLDGIIDKITTGVIEATEKATEGVHV